MSDDPKVGWYCIHIRGQGEISAWTDPTQFNNGMDFAELEQVCRIMYAPNGDIGSSKLSVKYFVRPDEITGYYEPVGPIKDMLNKTWGKASILPANGSDLKRLAGL